MILDEVIFPFTPIRIEKGLVDARSERTDVRTTPKVSVTQFRLEFGIQDESRESEKLNWVIDDKERSVSHGEV